MILWAKFGAIGALVGAAAGGYAGWQWRDGSAAREKLQAVEEAERDRIKRQDRAEWAGSETERRLAEGRDAAAAARTDRERVRELSGRIRASEQASERDRERIASLIRLLDEGAGVVEAGVERVGTLDARLAGCQATP